MCNVNSDTKWKAIDAISKLLIPIAIAVLVFYQTKSISDLEISFKKAEAIRQNANYHSSIELKLVELVWDSLKSGNEKEQKRALLLVENLQPDLRIKLAKVVELDKENSLELRKRANEIRSVAEKEILQNYKIDIYFDTNHEHVVSDIINLLKGKVKIITTSKKNHQWLKSVGLPLYSSYEIRYDADKEKEAARELLSQLTQNFPGSHFTLREVATKTPGTISLFLFKI